MAVKETKDRIVFGLKVRQLRQSKGMNFTELSSRSGISVSYLNEIEKGKKYPKGDKINDLAEALDVTAKQLTSPELPPQLAPVSELLQSGFLQELPLEVLGLDPAKIVDMIANAPIRVGAFVSTLVEISRNYSLMREEHFYFGALRAFLELNNNYFEDIETAVVQCALLHDFSLVAPPSNALLTQNLEQAYGYTIVPDGLDKYPDIANIRAVFVPKSRKLLLNHGLSNAQQRFQLAKELGFAYLDLKERAYTASLIRVNSFEEVLNHFKAAYFAAALLLPKNAFNIEIQQLLSSTNWFTARERLAGIISRYDASPEMVFQRLTNLLPQQFGLSKLFFLRMVHHPETNRFDMNKDLHLGRKHQLQRSSPNEHYCARWVAVSSLRDLLVADSPMIISVQRSVFHNSTDEYLVISISRRDYPAQSQNISVTLGILIDEETQNTVKFLSDPTIQRRIVNNTCERCPITDCRERKAPPVFIQRKHIRHKLYDTLDKILKTE